jgi:hypothetical protein
MGLCCCPPGWSRGQDLLGVAVTEIWVRQLKSCVNRMMLARPFVLTFAASECKDGKKQQAPVLCGCETWSVTLTGEHRLRVFEKVLRSIWGCERRGKVELLDTAQ